MGILKFVLRYFDIRKATTKLCLLLFALFTFSLHIWIYMQSSTIPLHILLIQSITLIIIGIWLISAPSFHYQIKTVKELYMNDHADCLLLSEKFTKYLYMLPGKKNDKANSIFSKALFICLWWLASLTLLYIIWCTLETEVSIMRMWTVILIFFSLLLNSSSYYICCVYVWFLNRFSKLGILCDIPHNNYWPIASYNFQLLSQIANNNSITFLLVSLAFSIIHLLIVRFYYTVINIEHILIAFITFALGIATFFVIYISSKIFLNRILEKWQEKSIKDLEEPLRLLSISDANEDSLSAFTDDIIKVKSLIKDVYEGNIRHKTDYISMLVGLTNFCLNIVSLYYVFFNSNPSI